MSENIGKFKKSINFGILRITERIGFVVYISFSYYVYMAEIAIDISSVHWLLTGRDMEHSTSAYSMVFFLSLNHTQYNRPYAKETDFFYLNPKKSGLKSYLEKLQGQTLKCFGFGEIDVWKAQIAPQNHVHFIGDFVFGARRRRSGRDEFCALSSRYSLSNGRSFVGLFAPFKRWFLRNQIVSEFALVGFPGNFSRPIFLC